MHEIVIKPRISEVNASGHVSNTALPVWLEEARVEFFEESLAPTRFTYMLVNLEQNFRREIFNDTRVQVKTRVKQLGNSSVTLIQEVWQRRSLAVEAQSVVVYVDNNTGQPTLLPPKMRELLSVKP